MVSRSAPRRTVLLIDASPDTLEMYAVGLDFAGYRALTATDAEAALVHVHAHSPDAIVTDLRLLGRDGWDLIRTLKQNVATRKVPVIILTGDSDPVVAVRARTLGCGPVLTKPCLPDELAAILTRVLSEDWPAA